VAPHRLTPRILPDEAALRALLGEPSDLVRSKVATRLNALTRRFIERSPFLCLATSAADGSCDVSPRGDPAGFVRILDDATLLLPDRPGNRIADSLRNILSNGRVGMLFLIPGVEDSFRVDGRAAITDDPALLAPCAVDGRVPRLGILVDIEHAYTQCGKALLRSRLWDPSLHVDRAELPTSGEIHACLRDGEFDAAAYDAARAARYERREGFY
jgi:PPOX class probable FMN-dependent enzyme